MIPRKITGANINLKPPPDWDESRNGKCATLWVRAAGPQESGIGVVTFESAWEPLLHELEILKAGGSVVIRVCGGQPAMSVQVEPIEQPVSLKGAL